MAAETHTFTPQKLFASDYPRVLTSPVTVVSGQNLAVNTIVASDANGKILAHPDFDTDFVADTSAGAVTKSLDVTKVVAGVLVAAVDATGGDTAGIIYESGHFYADQLVWPAGATTNALKRKLLEGSLIKVTFQDTGEV